MSDGTFHTQIAVGDLSPAQRERLDGQLRQEGIQATWAGDRVHVDSAYEARVESMVSEARGFPSGYGAPPPAYGQPAPYPQPAYSQSAPYGQPAYGQPYGAGGYYPVGQVQNQTALWAMLLGIGTWVLCGLCFIPAIILGKKAMNEIEASNGTQSGDGMAKAGYYLGIVYGAIVLLGLVALIGLVIIGAATTPSK